MLYTTKQEKKIGKKEDACLSPATVKYWPEIAEGRGEN